MRVIYFIEFYLCDFFQKSWVPKSIRNCGIRNIIICGYWQKHYVSKARIIHCKSILLLFVLNCCLCPNQLLKNKVVFVGYTYSVWQIAWKSETFICAPKLSTIRRIFDSLMHISYVSQPFIAYIASPPRVVIRIVCFWTVCEFLWTFGKTSML